MKQKAALLAGAVTGVVAAVVLRGRRATRETPRDLPDPRAAELREKLAQAREEAADESDFEAAGMGAETIVAEEEGDVEAARRRVHEQGRATAEEMRRAGDDEEAAENA